MEQVEGHRDDLALEPGRARAHVALQHVHVGEEPERLVEEVVVLVVAAVHRARALAGLPERVLLLRHVAQLLEDLVAGPALLGQRAVDAEPLGVGEVLLMDAPPGGRLVEDGEGLLVHLLVGGGDDEPAAGGEPPWRPVTTPPAASTIGIRATMS